MQDFDDVRIDGAREPLLVSECFRGERACVLFAIRASSSFNSLRWLARLSALLRTGRVALGLCMRNVIAPARRAGVVGLHLVIGLFFAAAVPLDAQAAASAALQTRLAGKLTLACRSGPQIVVDFDRATVTDSTSDQPVAAQITRDKIRWHREFDSYQFDPHYGGQRVHNTADYAIDRQSGTTSSGDVCDASNR
jgi:hypothetical protein